MGDSPSVSVQAQGGEELVVEVHNSGGLLKLKARIKLRSASRDIDSPDFHDYMTRIVKAGTGVTQYVIAGSFGSGDMLWLQAEALNYFQKWDIPPASLDVPVKFEAVMVFVCLEKAGRLDLGQWVIGAEYLPRTRQFTAVTASELDKVN